MGCYGLKIQPIVYQKTSKHLTFPGGIKAPELTYRTLHNFHFV